MYIVLGASSYVPSCPTELERWCLCLVLSSLVPASSHSPSFSFPFPFPHRLALIYEPWKCQIKRYVPIRPRLSRNSPVSVVVKGPYSWAVGVQWGIHRCCRGAGRWMGLYVLHCTLNSKLRPETRRLVPSRHSHTDGWVPVYISSSLPSFRLSVTLGKYPCKYSSTVDQSRAEEICSNCCGPHWHMWTW